MSLLWDIWNTIHGIAVSTPIPMLAVAVVIMLVAGFVMHSFESILTTTVLALIAFALAGYVMAVTVGGHNASAYATEDWNAFLGLHMLTLIAYLVIFAVAIGVVHLVRSLVMR
jgi:hypothetical protein